MQRLRLFDLRQQPSRLPSLLGKCVGDLKDIAAYVNSAQYRLLYAEEAGEEGWWGSWAEIAFNVSRSQPYVTLPREIARLEAVTVCDKVIPVFNQFYEYLQFGNGRMPKEVSCRNDWWLTETFSRNNAVTFRDLTSPPKIVRVYPTNLQDATQRTLLQGVDSNGQTIYSEDGYNLVQGVFLNLEQPFVDAPMQFNRLTGIQKDQTFGQVRYVQVDPTTGEESDMLTMEPSETTASYRRYFLNELPCFCCQSGTTAHTCPPGSPQPIIVKAIAKLDLIPVQVDTDYTLIQNPEAIINECQAVRYSETDEPNKERFMRDHHKAAIRLLNGELAHFIGVDSPAVQFAPFGSARLRRQRIGQLV